MMRRLLLLACLPAMPWLGGCRHETITPAPGMMNVTGLLLRCETIPLTPHLQLRRMELLQSDVSNDFWPWNVSRAVPADRLVSQLYVREGLAWKFLDFVEMPLAKSYTAANLSGDGERIIYERPDISEAEGQLARIYPRNRRTQRVVIYDHRTRRRFALDRFTELHSLGSASHWRPDGQAAAITTTCYLDGKPCPQVAIVDACGQVMLDAETMPELAGLEFISYSPDGSRLAALRPRQLRLGGRLGGGLVEVDAASRTVTEVAEISPGRACQHLGHFDRMVVWGADGHCRLRN